MEHVEPTPASLTNPVARYVLATRPPFLGVTLAACLLGIATAVADGQFRSALAAIATTIFALVAHAGVNVLNDYYDALNGTDANNTRRIFPYTGGSRFIQNGVLTVTETGWFGAALMLAVIPAGLWLAANSGAGLVWIGVAGLAVGWTYSAPPLQLNSRGLGEPCVALGFMLVVIGADYVQRGTLGTLPLVTGLPYALLVTNILFINQFPDRDADAAAGKRHWVVRLPPARSRWGYAGIALLAYGWLVGAVITGSVPAPLLAAALPAPLSAFAARELLRHAEEPSRLAPAIRATIAAAMIHGLAGALALLLWSGAR